MTIKKNKLVGIYDFYSFWFQYELFKSKIVSHLSKIKIEHFINV